MKHILFIALFIISLAHAKDYYVTPDGDPLAEFDKETTTLQTAADLAQPGDIIYLLPGIYKPAPNRFLLEYHGDGGDETRGPITFKSYNASRPVTFKTHEEDLLPDQEPNPNVGNWALVKIYPRQVEGRLYIPKYLTFENIIFEGNALGITIAEKPMYENQPGSYCDKVTSEGYLIKDQCNPMLSTCSDTDGDGVFNDNTGCEQVRYNGQGFLVTGPFNWDGAINPLIDRRKPDGTVIPGINNYAIPHHIAVRNCTFRYFPGAGLSFQRADYITVENCIIANNCWYTIFGSSGLNFYQMVPYEGAAVNYANDTDYRIKIKNNIVFGNSLRVENQNLVVRYDGNGIIVDDFTHEQDYRTLSEINAHRNAFDLLPINQNPTNPNRGYFYYGPYKGKTLVANNVVYGNGGSGLKVYSSQYVDVIHNTFFDNGIGNYRNTRTGDNQPPLGWLRPQNSLFVQSIVDETDTHKVRRPIMPGYNRVMNNLTYNTLGYPNDFDVTQGGLRPEWLAYSVALHVDDKNTASYNYVGGNTNALDAKNVFTDIPSLDTDNNKAVVYLANYFNLAETSRAIGCSKVLVASVNKDKPRVIETNNTTLYSYYRDSSPDAGAYELPPLSCVPKILLGTAAATIPANQSNNIGATERKLYRAQQSITFQGVYVTQLGAVVRTDISTCLMTMVPYAIGARMAHADFEDEEEATATESLAYPNPVKDGTLYFNTVATSYRLTSITGTKITEGNNAHKMSVLAIPTGIYLLTLDGKTQKIVIE